MPAWVLDDSIWKKAKDAAAKSYDVGSDVYWQSVTAIYKNMGGGIKSAKQESNRKESVRLMKQSETDASSITRFDVVLLQEGMGNFGTAFYYTQSALESAVPLFNGEHAMLNHMGPDEEQNRPEGDVKDLAGYYSNLQVVEANAGQHELRGTLNIPAGVKFDKARDLAQAALEYAKEFTEKDFIGLSINASGDADEKNIDDVIKSAPEGCKQKLLEAKEQGIDTVFVTSQIVAVESCDMVTKAGAGGKILKLLESAKEKRKMAVEKQKQGEDGAPAPAKAAPAGDKTGSDNALLKDQMTKHAPDHSDDDMQDASGAMEAYQGMGHSKEDSAMMAAKHVAASKQMKQKKAEAEAEAEAAKQAKAEAEGESEAKKEAARKRAREAGASTEVVKLAAENSALKERIDSMELNLHRDRKMSESKLPSKAREALKRATESCKSIKEFDRAMNVFVEARATVDTAEIYADNEREVSGGNGADGSLSFADAGKED